MNDVPGGAFPASSPFPLESLALFRLPLSHLRARTRVAESRVLECRHAAFENSHRAVEKFILRAGRIPQREECPEKTVLEFITISLQDTAPDVMSDTATGPNGDGKSAVSP